jgi:hypothetical protein
MGEPAALAPPSGFRVYSGVAGGRRPRRRVGTVAASAALVGLLLTTLTAPAAAATYHAHDGTSLQAAVTSADASSGPSTIELSAGTFVPASTLDLTGEVTIVGPSLAPPALISGTGVAPSGSDLLVVGPHGRVTLWNLELTAAGGPGAGAAIDDFGTVDVESSTVAGNSGAGAVIKRGASGTVRNSTFSDGLDVGVVDLGTLSAFNATIAGNANGGIDDSAGALRLTNTIIAKDGGAGCTRPAAVSDHSLDGDGSCGVGALAHADPRLEKLAANGGPTLTRALGAGSPAIDAGDDSNCPPEDQRHFARTDGRCDIGAFEVGGVPVSGGGGPGGSGRGRPSSPATGGGIVGVSAHGALRGARRTRIFFTLRALVGHARASFRYTDRAGHLLLHALTIKRLAIDAAHGVATITGTSARSPGTRRVGVTVVLTSRGARRGIRINVGGGYFKNGRLLNGSITFISRGRSAA